LAADWTHAAEAAARHCPAAGASLHGGTPARGENSMLLSLFQVVDLLLRVLTYVIIAQAILSWLVAFNVINTYNDFVRSFLSALDRITEPLYRPIRRIMPDFGGIDFSPMVVLLLIYIVRILLSGVAADVAY
jgi:YggT family protein